MTVKGVGSTQRPVESALIHSSTARPLMVNQLLWTVLIACWRILMIVIFTISQSYKLILLQRRFCIHFCVVRVWHVFMCISLCSRVSRAQCTFFRASCTDHGSSRTKKYKSVTLEVRRKVTVQLLRFRKNVQQHPRLKIPEQTLIEQETSEKAETTQRVSKLMGELKFRRE